MASCHYDMVMVRHVTAAFIVKLLFFCTAMSRQVLAVVASIAGLNIVHKMIVDLLT